MFAVANAVSAYKYWQVLFSKHNVFATATVEPIEFIEVLRFLYN